MGMNLTDVNKAWNMANTIVDELEMRNYLELLKQANREGILDKESYHQKLTKYIELYEKK